MYRFAAASETELIVFGASRPGYSIRQVQQWIEFMQTQGIQRVCCLLPETQLARYSNLLETYQQVFGTNRVCWAPLEDLQIADSKILTQIALPFLLAADRCQEMVVVHCSGGIGRTGQVLAAWLVRGRGLPGKVAIATVRKTGRNPYEAAIAALFKGQNPRRVMQDIHLLLEKCREL